MSPEATAAEKEPPKRLFIPSLTLLVFIINISSAVLSLFLPEIAKTFLGSENKVAIGIVSQTSTVNSAAEVALAFIMSVLAIRFRHKSLLLVGAILVVFSNVGSYLAPDLITFQIFFALEGAGSVMVSILAITLIGDTLPFNKKARAVSWFVAGTYMAVIIGLPTLLFLANIAGWRSTFLLFGLPVSILGLILASVSIPSRSNTQQSRVDKSTYVKRFKQILLNKSSIACLIGKIFGSASIVSLYIMTFYRQQLSLAPSWAVGLALINSALFLVGSLIGGRLVNRFGAKPVAVICGFTSGILTAAFFNMPTLWLTLAFNFTSVIIGGFAIPAFICLTVDQVPKARGTMMSLHRIALNTGEAIGAFVGGAILALFSFQVLGLVFGAFSIASAVIFLGLVKQPTAET
jgi:MFS transporter, DHA1 family, inner membrane transport protein